MSRWDDTDRLNFLIDRPWLSVLTGSDDYRYAVVDRKAGGRITGLHDTYRQAIDEAIMRVRGS